MTEVRFAGPFAGLGGKVGGGAGIADFGFPIGFPLASSCVIVSMVESRCLKNLFTEAALFAVF